MSTVFDLNECEWLMETGKQTCKQARQALLPPLHLLLSRRSDVASLTTSLIWSCRYCLVKAYISITDPRILVIAICHNILIISPAMLEIVLFCLWLIYNHWFQKKYSLYNHNIIAILYAIIAGFRQEYGQG
jgi:hypothetical protein